ncbi:calcium-binding protein [Tritonibacter horizontis]|uniref:Bifunctional hemolysin/adenylate cyclase n=1 Tax=Tritonibacter horizontis TaxID=1768241 RepID=A0A132C0H2_9RHOB|nr:calcium-binding protein [Tritonibacter horizontis]KUP93580.1 bifunctional hemolysin/adenylate cyclase precursor [Tritonibacter horizontis]
MAKFTWFDGNQGAFRWDDLHRFDVSRATQKVIIGEYNGVDGALEETRQPARFKMVLDQAETSEDANGDRFYTGGTVAKIYWYNSDGDVIKKATGLSVDLSHAWTFVQEGNARGLQAMLYDGGQVFVGSDDGMNPNGWNGDDIGTGYGDDTVRGRGGDDYIVDRGGSDIYNGGDGFDRVSYNEVFWQPWLGDQGIEADLRAGTVIGPDGTTDTLISIEGLRGTHFDDVMKGDSNHNIFLGLKGDDTINGRGGIDSVRYDRDIQQGGTNGVTVNLRTGTATDGFGDTDTLINIEDVRGSIFDDLLKDSSGDNTLQGRDGDDTLRASAGNDWLEGDNGADLFQFASRRFGADTIADFEVGTDQIEILKAKRFGQLTIEDNGDGNAVVSFARGEVELVGVSADDLSADDFLF